MTQVSKSLVISHLQPPPIGGGGGLGSNEKKNCDGSSPIDFFHKKPPLFYQPSPISSYFVRYLPGFPWFGLAVWGALLRVMLGLRGGRPGIV